MISSEEKGEVMKIAIAIFVVFAVFAAVFCAYTRVLALMECTGGDLSVEMEEQFLTEEQAGANPVEAADTGAAHRHEVGA